MLQASLLKGREAARGGGLVTFAIRPRGPSTSYGYVNRGPKEADGVYRVRRFYEKPRRQAAKTFVESRDWFWNSGMYVWETWAILEAIETCLPATGMSLKQIGKVSGTNQMLMAAAREYPRIQNVSIDYGVMEKAGKVLMVETKFDWDDVGTWAAAAARRGKDTSGNSLEGKCVPVETKDSLLLSNEGDHLVATLGLEGFIVVHTKDATLVCPKGRSGDLKKLVEEIRNKGHEKHL